MKKLRAWTSNKDENHQGPKYSIFKYENHPDADHETRHGPGYSTSIKTIKALDNQV